MARNSNIKGLDSLMKKLSNPQQLAKDLVDERGGIDVKCPNCQKSIKVPTYGVTCTCGQKLTLNFRVNFKIDRSQFFCQSLGFF